MPFLNLIHGYFVPSGVTCVNSMEVSYIPIANARGFTTHWIRIQYLNLEIFVGRKNTCVRTHIDV